MNLNFGSFMVSAAGEAGLQDYLNIAFKARDEEKISLHSF
jgi:hypothetical protein